MITNAYSIHDTKSETFNPPFYQKNAGEAIRSFTKIVNDKNSVLNEFPEDYVLVEIGQWDDEKGLLMSGDHKILGTASQYIRGN